MEQPSCILVVNLMQDSIGQIDSSNPPGSGEVTVHFPERSPFREDNVTGTEVPGEVILTLVSDRGERTLPFHYYIKPPRWTEAKHPLGR